MTADPTTIPPALEVIPGRSLHRKLAQIMYEAERIPKNGRAPQAMGGYPFVQVGDAADYIRKALGEQGLTMMPTHVQVVGQVDRPTKAGGSMTTVDLIVDWTITDGESGESITIQSFGAGADGGDKYSGKASTSAMKYALLSGFLLSTGDDTELGAQEGSARPHADADSSPNPTQQGERGEIEEMMGRVRRRGIVRKGTADDYKLAARQGPDGHVFGFRLEIDGKDKNIPQCLMAGPIGEAAFLALGMEPLSLVGKVATVAGILYNVKRPDKPGSWYRLHVDLIETEEFILPAPAEDMLPAPPAGPIEADSTPLFTEGEWAGA